MKDSNALPQVVQKENGSKLIKLRTPIKFGEEVIPELVIKKPIAKDLRGLKLREFTVDDLLNVASKLSQQPPSALDLMGMADLQTVLAVVNDFLDDGGVIGKTP